MSTELKPHGYQERAIDFGIETKNVFYAMDMGLGKTMVILNILKEKKRVRGYP